MVFKPHGYFTIEVVNNTVIICVEGAWNLECANEFVDAAKEVVTREFIEQGKTFKVLCDISEDWLPTHDSVGIFPSLTEWGIHAGLIKEAFVFSSNISKSLLTEKLAPVSNERFEYAFFAAKQAAIEWLEQT